MARMRQPNAGDPVGIGAGFKPVADLAANGAAPGLLPDIAGFRRFSRYDQQHSHIPGERGGERLVKPDMGGGKAVSVQVYAHVRSQGAATDSAFPS